VDHLLGTEDDNNSLSFEDMVPLPPPLHLALIPDVDPNPAPDTAPNVKLDFEAAQSSVAEIQVPLLFIKALKNVGWSDIDPGIAAQLKNPIEETPSVEDADHRFCLETYLLTQNASQETYDQIVKSYCRCLVTLGQDPDILSFYQVEKLVRDLTGVEEVYTDM
jgi:hypothetical protein